MGCDIHMYSEIKRCDYPDKERKNGLWTSTDTWRQGISSNRETGAVDIVMVRDSAIYINRNYTLFSILAGVRNGGKLTPISDPKDLPDDVSSLIKAESDRWGWDGHSHSYFTLRELLEYDWNQKIETTDYWNSEYEAVQELGDSILRIKTGEYGVEVSYLAELSSFVTDFLDVIEIMKDWLSPPNVDSSQVVTEDDIRIVFWFDN